MSLRKVIFSKVALWFAGAAAALALLSSPPSPTKRGLNAVLAITCPSTINGKIGAELEFSCKIVNQGQQVLFVLAAPLVLEGPTPPESDYIYFYSGGNRVENVLVYSRGKDSVLHLSTVFDPYVHLKIADFSRLVALQPGKSRQFTVRWPLKSGGLPDAGEWSARIKLIFLTSSAVGRISKDLASPVCRRAFVQGISKAKSSASLTIAAKRKQRSPDYSYDGCRDIVSEATSYSYSNSMLLRLRAATFK